MWWSKPEIGGPSAVILPEFSGEARGSAKNLEPDFRGSEQIFTIGQSPIKIGLIFQKYAFNLFKI